LLIVNVAVATTMQGRGFGNLLLKHAEELAALAGLKRTRLHTNKLFAENIRLYEALGYRFDREEPLNSGVAIYMSNTIVSA
jgi:ribosomal protein S18 acetylase RimI-like enzyme